MHNIVTKITNTKYNIVLQNDVKEISKLEILVETIVADWTLYNSIGFNLNLAIEEAVSNIIIHGKTELNINKEIIINVENINDNICVEIKDNCKPFNPLSQEEKNIEDKLENIQVGGLGIYFIKKLTNNLEYKRYNSCNILSFEIINHE